MPDKPPPRILVVDDDETNRDLLSRRLTRQGYHVQVAASGAEALEKLRTMTADMVLLDVMMPDMDGLEVLTAIRESYTLVDLPVIMVSARDQGGDFVSALQMGANDYVTKPINFPVMFARIHTHLTIQDGARAQRATGVAHEPPHSPATSIDFPTEGDRPLVGDYEVLGELGRGGMGVVYKARHVRMNRVVALKVIDKDRLCRPDAVRRFYQEVEMAARLSHPNVVLAYDAGQAGETHYFAMEYVDGQDLDRYVRERGPLPVGQACDFMRQAALGLQHAHESGMVHRDVKPSNLLIAGAHPRSGAPAQAASAPPALKILDMGLARLHQPDDDRGTAGELTREGRVIGSVDFMAPEQWMNASKVDVRADLYSLGCTFYYLLTGRVPFPGDEPMEKMLKHHLDQPVPLEQLRPEVPAKVVNVVRRLMAKRREDRYQTPGELATLLNWICQADPGN